MTVLKQRAWTMLNAMPEREVKRFVMMNVRYEQKEPKKQSTNATVANVAARDGKKTAWSEFEELYGCITLPDDFNEIEAGKGKT